jgi:hypothetical protein
VKWAYKNCEVEIDVIPGSEIHNSLTPIVQIDCTAANGKKHCLVTKESFLSEMEAQLHGVTMAREWIDVYTKDESAG